MLPEVESYVASLRRLRDKVLRLCEGLSAEALNWRPPAPESNSIFVIATHVAGSEAFWIHQGVGGIDIHRDREAEFRAHGEGLSELVPRFEAVANKSEEILLGLSESDLASERAVRGESHRARWCILHVVEHMALHVGHIELTRQLWEAQYSSPKPEITGM